MQQFWLKKTFFWKITFTSIISQETDCYAIYSIVTGSNGIDWKIKLGNPILSPPPFKWCTRGSYPSLPTTPPQFGPPNKYCSSKHLKTYVISCQFSVQSIQLSIFWPFKGFYKLPNLFLTFPLINLVTNLGWDSPISSTITPFYLIGVSHPRSTIKKFRLVEFDIYLLLLVNKPCEKGAILCLQDLVTPPSTLTGGTAT